MAAAEHATRQAGNAAKAEGSTQVQKVHAVLDGSRFRYLTEVHLRLLATIALFSLTLGVTACVLYVYSARSASRPELYVRAAPRSP